MSGKDELRRRAEEVFQAQAALTPQDVAAQSPEAIQRTLHELSVHQIELEMQNEELRRTQIELQESQTRYLNLFDFAPVGYFTLNDEGLILEANLTAAQLLGSSRNELKLHPISRYIHHEDQDTYYQKRKLLVRSGLPQACDLRMVTRDKALFWGHLEMTAAQDVDGLPIYRVILSDITERKRSEEALRKSEEKLGSIYQAIPVPTYTWQANDGDFILIDFNQAARDITRGRITEMMGIRASRLYHDHPDIIKNLSDCYLTHTSSMRELKYLFQTTGETKLLYIKFVFVEPDLVLVHTEDITERKQAEDALRESEERLETIFRMSPAALAITSLSDYQFVSVNDAWQKLTGYTSAEAVGHTSEHLNLWVRPTPYDTIIQMIRDQGVARSETQIRCKDGQIHDLLMSAEIVNLSGQQTLLTTALDITERKQAEDALRESEQRYRSLFDSMITGFALLEMIYDDTGHAVDFWVREANPAHEKLTTLKTTRVLGRKVSESVPEIDELWIRSYERVDKSGNPEYFEWHGVDPYRWYGVHVYRSVPGVIGAIFDDITERKRAEEALRQSESMYRSLVDNAHDTILVAQDGLIKFVNPKGIALVGMESETDLLGKPFANLIHPDDRDMVLDNYKRRLAQEKLIPRYAFRILESHGATRWVEINAVLIEWQGRPATLNFLTDITERKQTEEALSDVQVRLQNTIEGAQVGTWEWNVQTGVVVINDIWAQIAGYTLAEVPSTSITYWISLVHPDDLKVADKLLKLHFSGELAIYENEYRIKHKDGRWVWVSDRGRVITRDADGNPLVMYGTHNDISERKLAEEALQESEQQYRLLAENTSDTVWLMDMNLRIIYISPSVTRNTGYTPDEIKALPLERLMSASSLQLAMTRMAEVMARRLLETPDPRAIYPMELEFIRKDGSPFWSEDTFIPIRDESGIPTHILATGRDISERKKAEAALRQEEERYRSLMINAPLAIFINQDDKVALVNNACIRLLGATCAEDLIGKSVYSIFHSDYHELNRQRIHKLRDLDQPVPSIPVKVVRLDGRFVDVEVSAASFVMGGAVGIHVILCDITEQLAAEAALRQSEVRFRSLFEQSQDGIMFATLDDRFTDVNEAYCRMLGYSRDELLRMGLSDVVATEIVSEPGAIVRTELARGGATFEGVDLHRDGHRIPVEVTTTMLKGSDTVVAIVRDITERKRAEMILRESEERLREVLENSLAASYKRDLASNEYDYMSPVLASLTGYTAEEMKTLPLEIVLNLVHLDDKVEIERVLAESLVGAAGTAYQVEYRLKHKDGRYRWLLDQYTVMRDTDGKPIALIGSVSDVTVRKQAEEALKLANDRLLLAAMAGGVGIWELDVVNNVLTWDNQMYRLYGITAEQFGSAYESWSKSLHPQDLEQGERAVQMALRGEKEYDIEFRVIWPDGTIRNISGRAIVHRDKTGRPIKMIGTNYDITERLQAETALRESEAREFQIKLSEQQQRTELERKAAQALREKSDELMRSNRELSQFAYVASHDLQEPLRMVASYTELLAERYQGQLDDKADKYIAYAVEGAVRIQQLIHALLDFSKVGTRNRPLEQVDCPDLMRNAIQHLSAVIAENQAQVIVGELPTVMADPVLLEQVFEHLVDNALKFRSEVPPRVEVTSRRNGDNWEFCVADNGIGIPSQFQHRLFVIFQRLHARGQYAGVGIGLPTCKKIIEQHGGRIWVESEEGEGARFWFTLPVLAGVQDS